MTQSLWSYAFTDGFMTTLYRNPILVLPMITSDRRYFPASRIILFREFKSARGRGGVDGQVYESANERDLTQ